MSGLPVFKALGTPVGGATVGITVAWPAHVAGDHGFLAVSWRSSTGQNVNIPSGWTELGQVDTGTSPGFHINVFQRVAQSSAEPSVTLSGGSVSFVDACIITYTGVNVGTPIHAFCPSNSSANNPNYIAGGTSVLANCLVLGFVQGTGTSGGPYTTSITNGSLTSVVTRLDSGTTLGTGGGLVIAEGALVSPATIDQWVVNYVATPNTAPSCCIFLQSADHALPTSAMKNRFVDAQM